LLFNSFGDFLVFTPHCHILVTDGCLYGNTGIFRIALPLERIKREADRPAHGVQEAPEPRERSRRS
jgi:hypothetical protein